MSGVASGTLESTDKIIRLVVLLADMIGLSPEQKK